MPGWVCRSPELPEPKRLLIEGKHRWVVAKILKRPYWAFDLGRFVPEQERIRLEFGENFIRRRMGRDEIAQRAARYIELEQCTDAAAAKALRVSPATLCRAFGQRRIPEALKSKTDLLSLSIRSLVAAVPAALMSQAVDFALTTRADDGKKPTRDQVAALIQQLKKSNGQPKGRKAKSVTLRLNGRLVTFTVDDRDSATSVAEDLKAIVARLGKHADVPPDGWHFLFQ